MKRDNLLVIGAGGQIGAELTTALRKLYGDFHVVAADLGPLDEQSERDGPYEQLNVLDKGALSAVITRYDITQVYLLAAKLSATSERVPEEAWHLNMQGLLNVLDLARSKGLAKVFWPSSIAVFGSKAPRKNCAQDAPTDPETVYGISKLAGENWCRYYWQKYGVDVRSLRYPGLISHKTKPGGGTTDYAVDIFHQALLQQSYTCFLQSDTRLPMMYMTDAIRATLELMESSAAKVSVRSSYNITAMSFTPEELAAAIRRYIPGFRISYAPDERLAIAKAWPESIDDSVAIHDWQWEYTYGISATVRDMLLHLSERLGLMPGNIKALHAEVFF